jgi:uncharacterized protein (UPF0333 family)
MKSFSELFIRTRETIIRRTRAQSSVEYTLIVLGVFIVYVLVMALWVAIQNDPD